MFKQESSVLKENIFNDVAVETSARINKGINEKVHLKYKDKNSLSFFLPEGSYSVKVGNYIFTGGLPYSVDKGKI